MPRFFAFPGENRPRLRRRLCRTYIVYIYARPTANWSREGRQHAHSGSYIYIVRSTFNAIVYICVCVCGYKNERSVVIGHVSRSGIRDGLKGYYIIYWRRFYFAYSTAQRRRRRRDNPEEKARSAHIARTPIMGFAHWNMFLFPSLNLSLAPFLLDISRSFVRRFSVITFYRFNIKIYYLDTVKRFNISMSDLMRLSTVASAADGGAKLN